MNDALRMQISAFVDDELPKNESELLLRRLSQDAALRQQAAVYLQIGRLIRREREVPGMGELRNRIAAALGEQPEAVPVKTGKSGNRLLKPAAGFAVAASVAVVALFGLRQVEVPGSSEQANESVTAQTVSAGSTAGYTEPSPQEASSAPGDILTQYYLSHGATSADLGANGVLTRLVTLELREGELVEVRREATAPEAPPPDEKPALGDDK
ncbi:MAG: sigma-E factor negative regulatory protein [Woeseia sp.]